MFDSLKKISNSLILFLFLCFNSASRIILIGFAIYEQQIDFNILEITQTICLGIINDIIASLYFLIPFALFNLTISKRNQQSKFIKTTVYIFYFILIVSLCFLAVSEFTFWLEFGTKFNFIAVDYLIYTNEVVGNITESYPIYPIFSIMFIVAVIVYKLVLPIIEIKFDNYIEFKTRMKKLGALITAALIAFLFYNPKITDIYNNNYLSELSKNGLYNLFSAFRHNTLDYDVFYKSKNQDIATNELFNFIKENNEAINPQLLERRIEAKGPKFDYNVILIPMESMSSEFLENKSNDQFITPNLRSLITQSLYFSKIYATGTRTVRGLEALSLSIPPIPGQSMVRRHNNSYLFSISSILKPEGYDLKFIYGGYGYFDNMNKFFIKNGFKVIDRNDFNENEITFANIWGVSDEDLYNQVIKQADLSYAQRKKFFSLVMNVSNHRPYTYLEGKIDIPPKTSRHGGVKYADFALGEFIKIAQTKPWFDNTIFVITADHCAGSAGKIALPPAKYRIPLLFYAPKIIKPQVINKVASQIDIAPTILGLLNISYNSRFFGNDILTKKYNNAFISTFQKLGYIENNKLIILSPGKISETYKLLDNDEIIKTNNDPHLVNRAINYYQTADYMYKEGMLKVDD